MSYITSAFYTETFHGHTIPDAAFARIADDASVMIDSIVQTPVTEADKATPTFQRAVCYQAEMLYLAGGVPALNNDTVKGTLTSFSNDGYSESRKQLQEANSLGGLPVSSMAIAILRQLGYLKRWVYSGREAETT